MFFVLKKLQIMFLMAVFLCNITAEATDISANSAVVIDAVSGEILFEKNAYEKRGMASTTKIMTAIVALEKGNKEDIVEISEKAAGVEGSSMYLKAGEKISLENLLYGLMLVSGNDAATAIAEHIAGSEENFARLMNDKAREIGVKSTNFTNPHGLSDDNHYTTAYDLAQITAYGMENPVFAEIVGTKSKTIRREGLGETTLVNHNKLLKTYEGYIGVKTGFTKATGRCLVSASKRNGAKIVCVTLSAGDDWNDHRKLIDKAFEGYKTTLYQRAGTLAETVRVKGGTVDFVGGIYGEDIYLVERNEEEWTVEAEISDNLSAPVRKGDVIGKARALHRSGKELSFDIIAEKDVNKKVEEKRRNFNETVERIFIDWLCLFSRWINL